ncbi:unnamed protein product [Coccothraustes coccothraustes]
MAAGKPRPRRPISAPRASPSGAAGRVPSTCAAPRGGSEAKGAQNGAGTTLSARPAPSDPGTATRLLLGCGGAAGAGGSGRNRCPSARIGDPSLTAAAGVSEAPLQEQGKDVNSSGRGWRRGGSQKRLWRASLTGVGLLSLKKKQLRNELVAVCNSPKRR